MIAACPKCGARYRIDPARLRADGVRLRCSKCEAVFRITPPRVQAETAAEERPPAPLEQAVASGAESASAAAPRSEEQRRQLVLMADAEVEAGKALANTLAGWGLEPVLVHDGVEAILTIQRILPRVVILDAGLPKMFGFQICELMKRNESLRSIQVVLVGDYVLGDEGTGELSIIPQARLQPVRVTGNEVEETLQFGGFLLIGIMLETGAIDVL